MPLPPGPPLGGEVQEGGGLFLAQVLALLLRMRSGGRGRGRRAAAKEGGGHHLEGGHAQAGAHAGHGGERAAEEGKNH